MTMIRDAVALVSRTVWWLDGPLLGPLRQFASAVVITAGPWIVSVTALAIISITMTPLMGGAAIEDLRLSVVSAFVIAPLISGPIGTIAARLISNSVEERAGRFVFEIFGIAALGSGGIAMAVAAITATLLSVGPLRVVIGFVWMTVAAALLWITFAVLAALRFYRLLILSFSTGMLLSIFCTLAAARAGPNIELLLWSFTAGIAFCVILAFVYVSARYWNESDSPDTALWLMVGETSRLSPLALGIVAGIGAVWTDKIVFWLGPYGMRSEAGFIHFGPYDSVMFIAHLSIIPSLAAMLLFQNGVLRASIGMFRATLTNHSTYNRVRSASLSVGRTIWGHIFGIGFMQASCSAGLILMAPIITELMDFNLAQFDLLRISIVAVFFQSLLFLSSSILIVCQRVRIFCMLQLSFLALNAITSMIMQWCVGVNSYAVFVSSMVAAVAASLCAYRALSEYDYLIFVRENESLYEQPQHAAEVEAASRGGIRMRIAAAREEWSSLVQSSASAREVTN
jgi:uncharacterized membrane protein